jgi:signal transduction histidine kinase/ligand-binding sensor domain-containing protein
VARDSRLTLALRTLAALAAAFAAPHARALDADLSIAQFYHTAWTVKEGAPGEVTALAQTADGWLWIGTHAGLYRFDGVRFERVVAPHGTAFPSQSVSALYAAPRGGLWIGYRYGDATLLDGDRLTNYSALDGGFSTGSVFGFAAERDGTIWAATFRGLQRFDGTRWRWAGGDRDFPGTQARAVFVDRDGTVWAASEDAIARLPRGAARFERVAGRAALASRFAQGPDGAIWIAETGGGVRRVDAAGAALAPAALSTAASGLLFDRDGGLWIASAGQGLRRMPRPASGAVQAFEERDGLSADFAGPLVEDREGSLWVGTSRGLDRLRRANLVPAALPNGAHDFALAAGERGEVWVGTRNRPLLRLAADGTSQVALDRTITCAYRDRDGGLWFGGSGGIWRRRGESIERIAELPAEAKASSVQAIARDAAGTLWVSLNVPGVFLYRDGRWVHWREQAELLTRASPLTLMADARGAVWLGFSHNRIVRFDGATSRLFDDKDGLDIGNVTALHERRDGRAWIGGARGLALFDGARFASVAAEAGAPFEGATGIVERANGELWINAGAGVVRIDAVATAAFLADASRRVAVDVFDTLDGRPGIPPQFRPLPSAVEASDGRLWFATTGGVVALDPARLVRNPLPPPVSVRSLHVGDVEYPLAGVPRLPPRPSQLRIGYTATSLAIPERVRFRYRLEGQDADWQNAGTRREASYTNLAPGAYRFRVIAANDAGVWNEAGAAIDFVVAPAFFETAWFRALAAAAVLGVLYGLYLARLRRVAERVRARAEERHLERERIARELHDTLLQGVQGLLLKFDAAVHSLPDGGAKERLGKVLDRAREVVVEGRDRVMALRASGADRDLAQALDEVAAELAPDGCRVRVIEIGEAFALDPLVADEAYYIAREALINALKHARAARIDVEVDRRRGLAVRVRDDGCGIDPAILAAGAKAGQWGLPGMRERAARIGATLAIRSRAGATLVELRVPAKVARG